jgi:hypothetical protein
VGGGGAQEARVTNLERENHLNVCSKTEKTKEICDKMAGRSTFRVRADLSPVR